MSSAEKNNLSRRTTWRHSLLSPEVWKRSACYGLPAGVIQVALNQGDSWMTGHVTGAVVMKTILSPLVGFAVAFVAAVTTHHETSRLATEAPALSEPVTEPKHGLS